MDFWVKIKDFLERHQFIARTAFWLGMVGGVLGIIGYFATISSENKRADELTQEVLGQTKSASDPSSAFISATNVLANGEADIQALDASGALDNKLSDDELEGLANSGELINRLQQEGPAQLKKLNKRLIRAAEVLNNAYGKLADCYRSRSCGKGCQFERLCKQVSAQDVSIERINAAAQRIRGINFNESGAPPFMSGGLLDVSFDAVRSDNVAYLAHTVCRRRTQE